VEYDEELEALKLALKTEQDGRTMYLNATSRISNPLAKSTLSTLADEELVHIQLIEDFYNDLKSGGPGVLSAQLKKAVNYDLRRKTIFEAARGRMEKTIEADPDVFEAYKAAIKFEEDGAKMYNELAGKTGNDTARQMYVFLNEQENDHYRILAETLHYLENPNEWFIEQEKPHFEG
jgi:rubrerythrin